MGIILTLNDSLNDEHIGIQREKVPAVHHNVVQNLLAGFIAENSSSIKYHSRGTIS